MYNTDFTETTSQKSILSILQKFLMEFGKGYAFVKWTAHIHSCREAGLLYRPCVLQLHTEMLLVLIDLKTEKITHELPTRKEKNIKRRNERKSIGGPHPLFWKVAYDGGVFWREPFLAMFFKFFESAILKKAASS